MRPRSDKRAGWIAWRSTTPTCGAPSAGPSMPARPSSPSGWWSTLWRYWQTNGHLSEGRALVAEALAMPGARDAPGCSRVGAVAAAGNIAYWQGDTVEARRWYVEQAAAARAADDEAGARRRRPSTWPRWSSSSTPTRPPCVRWPRTPSDASAISVTCVAWLALSGRSRSSRCRKAVPTRPASASRSCSANSSASGTRDTTP